MAPVSSGRCGLAIPPVDPKAHQLHMAGHVASEQGLRTPLAAASDKVVFAAGHTLTARKWIDGTVTERYATLSTPQREEARSETIRLERMLVSSYVAFL